MKKAFEPIKLRENSRERVLRELISYNEIKGNNEGINEKNKKQEDNFSNAAKPQRVLKPQKKKKFSIVMEILAGAAVIAMIAGIVYVSINKSGNTTQPSKIPSENANAQDMSESTSNAGSDHDSSSPNELTDFPIPVIEFVSSEILGVSVACNRQYYTDYIIDNDDDGSIILHRDDFGTETGISWNYMTIKGSVYSYDEEIYRWANDMYDHFHGTLQSVEEVTLGMLSANHLPGHVINNEASADGIKATRFSFTHDLPDINIMDCTDVYVVEANPYNDSYGSYIISVFYFVVYTDNNTITEYSTSPALIYETLDSFSFTAYTKKTLYILANDTYTDEETGISEPVNFSISYRGNVSGDGYEDRYDAFYSMLVSPDADGSNDIFKAILPMGNLYDVNGIRDINLSAEFLSTFNDSVAVDLYYPDYTDDGEASSNVYPTYGVLHTDFRTDTVSTDVSDDNLSDDSFSDNDSGKPSDDMVGSDVTTKIFEIAPNGDKLISVGDKYCTIYGKSEDYTENGMSGFVYDYVVYVHMENIVDENGNQVGEIISNIIEAEPPLTMTVYYDGSELETFPVQIYADELVVHGLEITGSYNN